MVAWWGLLSVSCLGTLANGHELGSEVSLTRPFTLEYEATIRNVLSREAKEDRIRQMKSWTKGMDSQTAERNLKQWESELNSTKPVFEEFLFSYDGKRLIYSETPKAESEKDVNARYGVMIAESSITVQSEIRGFWEVRFSGPSCVGLSDVPLLGVNLPSLPFERGGKVLDSLAAGTPGPTDALAFVPGTISWRPDGIVSDIVAGTPNSPSTKYRLSKGVSMDGAMLPQEIELIRYYSSRDPKLCVPQTRYRLRMTNHRGEPAPAERFRYESWIKNGDTVNVASVSDAPIGFRVDWSKGDLLAQIKLARKKVKENPGR